MFRVILITLIFSISLQPASTEEKVSIWGSFLFNMKRGAALNLIERHCENINYENKIYAGIEADGCRFSDEPFSNMQTSISLVFDHAFFKSNKKLKYIVFSFEDYEREELKRLYRYAENKWSIWRNWRCNPPRETLVIQATFQTCGASFDEGRVHLRNNITLNHSNSIDLNSKKVRITQMHFYLDGSGIFGNGFNKS